MDYYQKYIKYKNKYTSLKQKLYGGELEEELKINNFEQPEFKLIGHGMEGKIYKKDNKYAYKVMKLTKFNLKNKLDSIEKYKKASDLEVGPKYYGHYITKDGQYIVIVMEYIDGFTLENILKMDIDKLKKNNLDINIKDILLKEKTRIKNLLIEKGVIEDNLLLDMHDANFIYRKSDGKLLAIDL